MRRFPIPILPAAVWITALAGCADHVTAPGTVDLPPRVANAPTVLTMGGASVTLAASVWRDFMPGPGAPAGGSGLMVSARVTSANATPLPNDLAITSVWVVNGSQVWSTTAVENRRDSPTVQVGAAGDGPRWMTGVPVTVVIGLGIENSFERYLRVDSVPIGRTD